MLRNDMANTRVYEDLPCSRERKACLNEEGAFRAIFKAMARPTRPARQPLCKIRNPSKNLRNNSWDPRELGTSNCAVSQTAFPALIPVEARIGNSRQP